MKSTFTADFTDGGKKVKVILSPHGVSFKLLWVREKNNVDYFVPYEAIYRLAAKLSVKKGDEK